MASTSGLTSSAVKINRTPPEWIKGITLGALLDSVPQLSVKSKFLENGRLIFGPRFAKSTYCKYIVFWNQTPVAWQESYKQKGAGYLWTDFLGAEKMRRRATMAQVKQEEEQEPSSGASSGKGKEKEVWIDLTDD